MTDTAFVLPLPQTIGLLDCLDAVRARKVAEQEPAALVQHLRAVCLTMGQAVDHDEAEQAVALHLGQPTPLSGSCLGERPASADIWQQQVTALDIEITEKKQRREKITATWRRRQMGWRWLISVSTLITFLNYALMAAHLDQPDVIPSTPSIVGLSLILLTMGLIAWNVWRENHHPERLLTQGIKDVETQRYLLSEVPFKNRPDAVTLKAWSEVRGLTAAFYQIHTSSVPMLRQDVIAMKARVAAVKAEKDAQAEMRKLAQDEKDWQQGFERLALNASIDDQVRAGTFE